MTILNDIYLNSDVYTLISKQIWINNDRIMKKYLYDIINVDKLIKEFDSSINIIIIINLILYVLYDWLLYNL